jgi:hypothetical protein
VLDLDDATEIIVEPLTDGSADPEREAELKAAAKSLLNLIRNTIA